MATPAPASSARSRPTARSTASACSEPASAATARCSSKGCATRSRERFDVINLSLSTTSEEWAAGLHELADEGFFQRSLIVASAHNMPIESFPWRFASVISVGSHDQPDPLTWYANPEPPVDVFARGVDVEVAWQDGATITATGNSFATPHIAGICALIRAKHPSLAPTAVKHLLMLLADNAEAAHA